MRLARWLGSLLLLILPSLPAEGVEVIVHRAVSASQLSVANARSIFGMRQVKWPDGGLIRVFVLPDSHPVHAALCKERLNLYPYQMRQTWDRLVYSGMAQAPVEVTSDAEMIARVAATPGAIGYVSRGGSNDKVRELHVE
jgi:ABC-type phosphate transport system substrate-binding protein